METKPVETQIRALENKRFKCLTDNDFDALYALCDPDLHYIHTSGTIDTLSELFDKLRSGFYDYQSIEYDIVDIIDRQDCVIVRANFYSELLVDGMPRNLQNRALTIWKKQDNQFKLFLYQATAFSS